MKFTFLEGVNPKLPGIYKIINLNNGKYYLGACTHKTYGMRYRFLNHRRELVKNIHKNIYLQNSFNKYGENNFEFICCMNTPIEKTFEIEQYFLDIFKPFIKSIGYNIQTENNYSYYQYKNENNSKQKYPQKSRVLINPNNEIIIINNLKDFCKENNFNYRTFQNLCGNKGRKSCFGWRLLKNTNLDKEYRIKKINIAYDLINSNGERFQGEDYKELYKKFNLNPIRLYYLITNRSKNYQGWMNYKDYIKGHKIKFSRMPKNYDLIGPDGTRYQGLNCRKFCRENNLPNTIVSELITGKRKNYKGWRLT